MNPGSQHREFLRGLGNQNATRRRARAGHWIAWALCLCGQVNASEHSAWMTDPRTRALDGHEVAISLQFRRELQLPRPPEHLPINISADSRFVLYVNNQRVCEGPARGNLSHWRFETVELAPFLKPARNVLAVQVWNDANAAPLAQISSGRTALWVRAVNAGQRGLVDSGPHWRVRVDRARTVEKGMEKISQAVGPTFYAAGAAESFDASLDDHDWADPQTSANDWLAAVELSPKDSSRWTLVADALPEARYERVPTGRVVRASGVEASNFPRDELTIAPHAEATILLDAGRVLSAYPRLRLSGGAQAVVQMSYVEALYDPDSKTDDPLGPRYARFANRATVDNGVVLGLTDTYTSDGTRGQCFHPYWWRAWRFLQIKVRTAEQPLTLHDLETWQTGYPFEQRGRFESNDPELNAVWSIGWKTALLDAHETYMDTAYWEQLQYIGDARIQMLLSYEISGDARLAVQALDAFDQSRLVAGLPQSAWPSVLNQVIPPFALLWIGALHDHWMHEPDTAVLTRTLPGTRMVLGEFEKYVLPAGLVGPMPGWPFVDWRPGLDGWAYRQTGLLSCIITMQYIGALHEAADLESAVGSPSRARRYVERADRSTQAVNSQCWDSQRRLYADTPAKQQFSQHGAALAVLYDIAPRSEHQALLKRVLAVGGGYRAPEGVTETSYYFSFYLTRALHHAGLDERYVELLQPWREMVRRDFTTWPETPDPSRSDSHAWSSHPTVGLLEYVAGIVPALPGFARVRIEPHLGDLKSLDAAMVHPSGLIETRYRAEGDRLVASIRLPKGLSGEFLWKGSKQALKPGDNDISMVEDRSAVSRLEEAASSERD